MTRVSATPDRHSPAEASVKTLRIVHLAKYYAPALGGIETHVRQLAQAQASMGHEVSVVCINHRHARTVRELDGDVRLVRVGRLASLARFDVCPAVRGELSRMCGDRSDVVHLHVPNPTMLLALASVRRRAALVVGYHSDVVHQRALARLVRPFEHAVFRRAARIMTTSPAYAAGSAVLKRYAWKTEAVPLGIDLARFHEPDDEARAFAAQLQARYQPPLWLGVGRLVYYKGFDVAIDALAKTRGTLVLVGKGPLEEDLRRRADCAGVADRVVFLSELSHSQLVGAYHASTAFWFPSNARSEAFGLAQVEAMACGCPVINADIPHSGVPWVSLDDESGLTVGVGDPAALALAARRLHEDAALRRRLSHGARRRAGEFGLDKMAQRMMQVYVSAMDDTAAAGAHAQPRKPR